MIVLGFDGMDYDLTRQMMAEGRLRNLSRLASQGTFQPLGTSMPPQSPVAWSNFITGLDAGGHGIYDFVHRDPKTLIPYLSTSRAEPSDRKLKLGKYQIPLGADKVELLRHGQPFWDALEKRDIRTTVLRMPANFPPSGTASRELSGMGTPDILGTYGTFAYYTSDPYTWAAKDVSGGKIYDVGFVENIVEGTLEGPANPFLTAGPKITAKFTVYIDPDAAVAKLVVGSEERILQVGEWSDWIPIRFPLVPTQSVPVMARFYLKEVRPVFGMYVTPLNLDPMSPAMPISTPSSFAAELASATGRFYTQGMPEDTKAFKEGVFSAGEFELQARMAGEEVERQYDYVLERFEDGLLFYYFGNPDQVSHMMWRPMDPGHPAYKPEDARFADVVKKVYEQLDGVVGRTLSRIGPDTMLVVMSDHGFASWRRAFHLNTWLKEQGYLTLIDPHLQQDPGLYSNVDWSRTRAYGLGLNGLYINVAGRERDGIVDPAQREVLGKEIAAKLLQAVDPPSSRSWRRRSSRSSVSKVSRSGSRRNELSLGGPAVTHRMRMLGAWTTVPFAVFMVGRSSAAGPPSGRDTGVIEGHVSYGGEIPSPTIVMEGGRTQQVLYLSKSGGLQYAVAFLAEGAAAAPAEQDPPTLRQSGFIFEPQVLAVREGRPVSFTNEDGANHNVRSDADPPNRFSIYTGTGQMQSRRFVATGGDRPLVITCDVHAWMVAWIYVFAHPYFAVTDERGHFRIPGVGPGLHQLSIRQPAGGLQRDLRVQVTPGGVTHIQVRFTASELSPPPQSRRSQ